MAEEIEAIEAIEAIEEIEADPQMLQTICQTKIIESSRLEKSTKII